MERDREFLAELQSMSMGEKFNRTLGLIGEWHNHYDNKVYVSLSGGKDSTVLADIDAKWCKLIGQPLNLVFSNTGLEYPEIQRHVRELKPYFESKYGIEVNLTIVTPKMAFPEVVKKYGYPLIGKEVAEAIYYARRLRRERERERRRNDLHGRRQNDPEHTHTHREPWHITDGRCEDRESHPDLNRSEQTNRSHGRMGEVNWKRLEIGGAERSAHPDKHSENTQNDPARRVERSRGSSWYDFEAGTRRRYELHNFKHTEWSDWRMGCL